MTGVFYLWSWVFFAVAGGGLWVQTNLSFSSAQECQEKRAEILSQHVGGSFECGLREPSEPPGTRL